jgi:hypothetical protein
MQVCFTGKKYTVCQVVLCAHTIAEMQCLASCIVCTHCYEELHMASISCFIVTNPESSVE